MLIASKIILEAVLTVKELRRLDVVGLSLTATIPTEVKKGLICGGEGVIFDGFQEGLSVEGVECFLAVQVVHKSV